MHEMIVQSDFRAMSGTTALRRGFNGKQPRTRTIALSDCICTLVDGTQYIIEKNTRSSKNKSKRNTTYVPAVQTRHTTTLFSAYR